MMTRRPECPLVLDRLPALVSGDLPPGEAELVRAHLAGCTLCAAEEGVFAAVRTGIAAAAPAAGEWRDARARLAAALDAERSRRARHPALLGAAAALLLLGLAAPFLPPPRLHPGDLLQATAAVGQRMAPLHLTVPRLTGADQGDAR